MLETHFEFVTSIQNRYSGKGLFAEVVTRTNAKSKWCYGISNPFLVSCNELKDVSNIYACGFKRK
jgi:hypothetical protein